jgi:hypothetical protein
MQIIEGQTAHDVRRALAAHLKAEGQMDEGYLFAPGSVVLRCQRPSEIWDVEATTNPLEVLTRWLSYAAGCEKGVTDIAETLRSKPKAAAYTDLGGPTGAKGIEALAYLSHGPDVRCVWTGPMADLGSTVTSVGLHLELLAAASGKCAKGVERLACYARGTPEDVERVLAMPRVPCVPCPPLISTPLGSWLSDLDTFLRVGSRAIGYKDRFFRGTAVPLHRTAALLEQGKAHEAQVMASTVAHDNWRYLAERWVLGHQRPAGAAQ